MIPSITRAFSAEEFLRFCREKPANERYNACVDDGCALAQFGFPGVHERTRKDFGISRPVFVAIFGESQNFAVSHTFGALADRLEKVIGK